MSDLESLISMGFSKKRAKEALIETNNAGIDVAVEWLLITDGIDIKTNEENDRKAEIVSMGDNVHGEESACEQLKETEIKSETEKTIKPSDMAVNSNSNTRILVRLLDGKTLSNVFNIQEKLGSVVSWVQSHINIQEFGLMTNFPKKIFTVEDYEQSLDTLKLVPSAVVIVVQLEKWNDLRKYHGSKNDDESHKLEEKRRKEETEAQLKKMEEERLALERVRAQIEDDKAARRLRWPNLYQNSNEPSSNQLLPNQPQTLLSRPDNNRTRNKKCD